jgi:hypothetical protein
MKFILNFIALIYASAAFSYSGTSLTWQKIALEEKVQRKFQTVLSSLLKDNQYQIEVIAEVSDPSAPNFGDDGKKGGTRVSDIKLSESQGDYIAFSKMGLEVPVLDKYFDEDRTKLMNLYRFNETYDLFKNLSSINVTVMLSDKLPEDLVTIATKLVQSSKLSVSGIKPTVKFETLPMEWSEPKIAKKEEPVKKLQEEPKIWTKDWYEWASRWGNAFGLIFGALIIGIIAISLFRQWKTLMEKLAAQVAAKEKPEEEKKEEEEALKVAAQSDALVQEEEVEISHGFERFQQCLEQHTEAAINMIRTWLNESEENDLLALRGIAQQSSGEQMDKLMNGLTESQRDKWKSLLGKHLETAEINSANKHIFQEVIKAFLVPSRIKDGELLNLIMELNLKTTCHFLDTNKTQVGILMNLLSPSVIGKVLAEVDDDTADAWLLQGSTYVIGNSEKDLPLLKNSLKSFKEENSPSPFAYRIMSMILSATPSREITLYRALAKSGTLDMVLEVAKSHFPSELLLNLPATLLKEVMQGYPIFKRVELLASRPEEIRTTLLDILAEKGTPARDMLDMEIENVERDPSRQAALEIRESDIWQEFVKMTRIGLSKNSSYNVYTEKLIKEWSQKLDRLRSIDGGKAA